MREYECPVCGAALELDDELHLLAGGEHVRDRELAELNLIGVRAYNRLIQTGITTIGDLADRSERELLQMPGFGVHSVREVSEALAEFGLCLRSDE